MGAALPYYRADNAGLASRAGQAGAAEDLQGVGIASPATGDTVEIGLTGAQGGTAVFNAPLQHGPNSVMKALHFGRGQGVGPTFRMDLGLPQRLVHIDIAQPCETILIQQQGFDHTGFALELSLQDLDGEGGVKGFGAQMSQARTGIAGQSEPPEFARVIENELMAFGQGDQHVIMLSRLSLGVGIAEFSGHTEMDEELQAIIECKDDIFPAPGEAGNGTPAECLGKMGRGQALNRPEPADLHRADDRLLQSMGA